MRRKYTLTGILVLLLILISEGSVLGEGVTASGTEGTESSFIVKLGTFLLISAVLIFLLQWRQKKRDKKQEEDIGIIKS